MGTTLNLNAALLFLLDLIRRVFAFTMNTYIIIGAHEFTVFDCFITVTAITIIANIVLGFLDRSQYESSDIWMDDL